MEPADEVRSGAGSAGVKPRPRGEGRGVIERLLRAGFGGFWTREPMGPTVPVGWREESGEGEVTGCSKPALIAELGEEVLFARGGVWASVLPVRLKGPPTLRGEAPRTPEVLAAWLAGREDSSRAPGGKKAGLSLPYKARCWRARRSRRLSSLTATGLVERSDLEADISARRP